MDQTTLTLLSAAATTIAGLAGFIGKLFWEERKANEQLRKERRDDDKEVIILLHDVRRALTVPVTPTNSQIYELLQRVEERVKELERRGLQ